MPRFDNAGGRNFGYGKQMAYAGHNVLNDSYGGGHYSTVATHSERWGEFCAWTKEKQDIKDARDVSKELVENYGRHLAEEVKSAEMSVAYAQNLLSSVNVTLEALREDKQCAVSPSALVGDRSNVRTEAPLSMDREVVAQTAGALRNEAHDRAAAALEGARDLGMRVKEATLQNWHRLEKEAKAHGAVNIIQGTKGGRDADRWVPVSDTSLQTIEQNARLQGDGKNLLPNDKNWETFNNYLHSKNVSAIFQAHGLKAYHDNRASYACQRYQQITKHPAPCVAGTRQASKEADKEARSIISKELGHGRIDVLVAYIGSSK